MTSDLRDRLLATRLPAMPQVLLGLLDLCRSGAGSMQDFADLAGKDAGISARILAIANSAAFGSRRKSATLAQAMQVLGTDTLKSVIICESISQVFRHLSVRCPADSSIFWRRSLETAFIAREVAGTVGYPCVEEAYLGGLLLNVGRLALASICPESYEAFFSQPDSDAGCHRELETLALTHSQAGAWLIEQWELDSFLADCAFYHHSAAGEIADAPLLVRVAHVAHRLAECGADSPEAGESAALCGLPEDTLAAIVERARACVASTAEQLGIPIGEDPPDRAGTPDSEAQLAEAVGDMMLATAAIRPAAGERTDAAVAEALCGAAQMLFGFTDGACLLFDSLRDALVGVPLGRDRARLAQVAIAASGNAPVAVALRSGDPCLLDGAAATGIETRQLLRILACDAAACLPLRGESGPLGVIVCAVRPGSGADMGGKLALMRLFAAQAAIALEGAQARQSALRAGVDNAFGETREAAMRMVHEASNPLTIVRSYLAVLEKRVADGEGLGAEAAAEFSAVDEELERVARVISSFASRPPPAAGVTNLSHVMREVARIFEASGFASPGVRLAISTNGNATLVAGDTESVRQIVVNLVKNAVEAMPEGGEIGVALRSPINAGGHLFAELSVRDTGPGIPAELIERIFGELASTKAGAHRGLGLRIVKELTDRLSGMVTCRTDASGSEFTVMLPLAAAPAASGASRLPEEEQIK